MDIKEWFRGGLKKNSKEQNSSSILPIGSVFFYEKTHVVFGTHVTHIVSCRVISSVTKREIARSLLRYEQEHREIVSFILRAEQRKRRQLVIRELLLGEYNYVLTIHAQIWSFPNRKVTLLHTGLALHRNGFDNRILAKRIADFLRWHIESLAEGTTTGFYSLEEKEQLLTSSRIESKLHWLTSVTSKYYSEVKPKDGSKPGDRRKG